MNSEQKALEVTSQEQLTEKDLHCIGRHLQVFVKRYYHEEDVPDPCEICNFVKECTHNNKFVCYPYDSLEKVAKIANLEITVFKGGFNL